MLLYHATDAKNLNSILEHGIEPRNMEHIVYLAETKEDALKFMVFRLFPGVIVLKVEVPEDAVEESFDHSYSFFKCKAWYTRDTISPNSIIDIFQYKMGSDFT